ncbi:MAG: hypothetical protein AAF682_22450 [Planctomycetota bacterium]
MTVAGSLAHAGTGDSEWLELDREISSLSSPVTTAQGGITWSALLRSSLNYSDDDIATGGGKDIFGNEFQDIDLSATGQLGDFFWRIAGDMDFGDLTLEDAFVSFDCGELVNVLMGNHKPSFLRSANVAPDSLVFTNRTALGSVFDFWDNGIAARGNFEDMVMWTISAMNGGNGEFADHAWYLRLEYALGEGAGAAEGALGAGDEFAATIGLSYANFDDISGTGGDDQSIGLDFWGTAGPIGFGAEVLTIDDGIAAVTDEDFGAGLTVVGFSPDSTPWDVTGTYLINEDLEAGLRYENTDNDFDTTLLTLGIAWYMMGHNAKMTASITDIDSDSGAPDGTILQAGFTVGASGTFGNS